MGEQSSPKDSLNILVLLASFVILIAGIHYSAHILIPFFLSVFITILCTPPQRYLINHGVPPGIAVIVVLSSLTICSLLLLIFVGAAMNDFMNQLPTYQQQLQSQFSELVDRVQSHGIEIPNTDLKSLVQPDTAMTMAANVLKKLSAVLTNFLLICLTVVFILLEASSFKHKIQLAFSNGEQSLDGFESFMSSVNHYLAIKSIFSLITGIIIASGLALLGVNHAPLWGLLAFLLNYIPNIGSIIAAVPAVLLTLIQLGPWYAIVVISLYTGVNVILGNILEPRFMGKGLGLSALVVFLSLVFWGSILGPVGMILSIPLTMIVKLALEQNEDTRWIAILLGSGSFAKKELLNTQEDSSS